MVIETVATGMAALGTTQRCPARRAFTRLGRNRNGPLLLFPAVVMD
jgi:hypothetical protein